MTNPPVTLMHTSKNTAFLDAISVLCLVLCVLAVPSLTCGCGFLDAWALGFTAPFAGGAWASLLLSTNRAIGWRIVRILAAVITSQVLAKNLADVLWFGHQPMWPHLPQLLRP